MKDCTYINNLNSKLLSALLESSIISPPKYLSQSLDHLKLASKQAPIYHTHLWGTDLYYFVELIENSDKESIIDTFGYYTEHPDSYFIDQLFGLFNGRSIEIIDKIGHKEFDHYLRLDQTKSVFSHYPSELYELLSISEVIKEKLTSKKVLEQKVFEEHLHTDFDLMGMSELYELAEEVISELFTKVIFNAYELIETSEVQGLHIIFKAKDLTSNQINECIKIFNKEFSNKLKVSFI